MDVLEVSSDDEAEDETLAQRPIRLGVTGVLVVLKVDGEADVWGERVVAFEMDMTGHDERVLARHEGYVSKEQVQLSIFGADADTWKERETFSHICSSILAWVLR